MKTILMLAAVWVTTARADEEKVSERCALCHEQAVREWAESKHARAITESFLGFWEREGKKWECLVCHTSRYDRQAGSFSHEGVSCESCHGPVHENHPDTDKMLLPVSSETCAACHSITYGQWRVSAHGQKNIRCFDCHKMHGMHLRKDDPDQMCGACHTERLESFSHATHRVKGLHCISCHMPEVPGSVMKIRGVGVRGHTTGVGAETCAGCHREMVHASHEHAALEEEVQRLKAITPEALQAALEEKSRQADALRQSLRADRRVFAILSVVAFALGLTIGCAWRRRRRT